MTLFSRTNSEKTARRDVLVGRDMLCFSHDWSGDPCAKPT